MSTTPARWRCLFPLFALAAALAALAAPALADAPRPDWIRSETREDCASHDPLRQAFFGDTHVHTAYSFDASAQDTRNTPRDAYRFARGESLGIQPYDDEGRPLRRLQLARPLDFVAVTDHSELLGEISLCTTPGSPVYDSWTCWIHHNWPSLSFRVLSTRNLILRGRWGMCGDGGERCLGAAGSVWRETQAAAEEAYDRSDACRFTSFVAYEWTATLEDGINLHRNVIFRNARVPALPISWIDTPTAVALWDRLEKDCVAGLPGCDAITIPHNSNLSAGLMFESAALAKPSDAGMAVTVGEARRRARWEPLVEINQHKGDSECQLGAGTTDEACSFERLSYDRFGPKFSRFARRRDAEASNFVRWALQQGLRQQAELGANSLKYGIIASTDTHIAAPGQTEERGHPGHGGAGIGAAAGVPVGFPDDFEFSPGGLAVLWAEENSRDALFAAMQRREAYGTSGTRPSVRFFAGWDYPDDLCGRDDFVASGYRGGVPMGGDLPARPEGAASSAPRFAVWALQDPGSEGAAGTPLQRVQIVKGWLDTKGELHERVRDVAGGDNGAHVDLATCEPQGEGASSLCAVWSDADFDAGQPAFYYARVLENPSCRWSQYVCNAARVDCSQPGTVPEALAGCCSAEHAASIQERAWTSPIWYTPR